MPEERKGFLTPEQEKILDKLYKPKSAVAEKLDGPAIQLADNQGLERVKKVIVEKHTDALPLIYEVVDGIFEVLAGMVEESE